MPADVTPQPAVPEGQPAAEPAVPSGSLAEALAGAGQVAAAPAESQPAGEPAPSTPEPAGKTYVGGKYASDVELERAYILQNAETSRMAQELARYRGREEAGTAQPASTSPVSKLSTDQLEAWKEGHLLNLARYSSEQDQTKLAETASAIRQIDAELRKREVASITGHFERSTAQSEIKRELLPIMEQYKADLVPGNPLYDKAASIYQAAVRAGHPEGELTATSAVLAAAQLVGKATAGVEQSARKSVTQSIQQSLKEGVVAGAGKAQAGTPGVIDFTKMTDAEFVAWKERHLGQSWL